MSIIVLNVTRSQGDPMMINCASTSWRINPSYRSMKRYRYSLSVKNA